MKSVLPALLFLCFISVSFGLECANCVADSCESQSTTQECPSEWPNAACGSYKQNGLLRKSCVLGSWCNRTRAFPGVTDFECCHSDMCNSSAGSRGNMNVTFACFMISAVILKLFF